MDAAALARAIDDAFGSAPQPRDDALVLDDGIESERVRAALSGRHWREVSLAEVAGPLRSALGFLAPAAYRFYLPAFMTAAVSDFHAVAEAADNAVRSLTAPRRADIEQIERQARENPELQPFGAAEWEQIVATLHDAHETIAAAFEARVAGFDPSQAAVIRAFLEYVAREHGADFPGGEPRLALERSWADAGGR